MKTTLTIAALTVAALYTTAIIRLYAHLKGLQ